MPASFPPKTDKDRAALLQFIREAPIAHGPWQGFKQLFKAIEGQPETETELLAAMLLRLDSLPMGLPVLGGNGWHDVPEGGPRARWEPSERRLSVRAADGTEGSLTFSGYGSMTQLGKWAIVVSGDYNKAQLSIVDISDAAQPTIALSQELKNVNAWNALAYVARRDDHLFLFFNLSNPYSNVQLKVFDTSEKAPREVASLRLGIAYNFQAILDGDRLFFFGGNWNETELKTVDLQNPAKPALGGSLKVGSLGWGSNLLAAKSGLAYVVISGRSPGLKVIDGRDAANLQEIATLKLDGLTSVMTHQGRVYARLDPRELKDEIEKSRFRVIDDSNLDKPKLLGAPPSSRTIGYMKRRARRLMWKLAAQNADLYVDLAARLIEGNAEANGASLNLHDCWLGVDAVLGKSQRFAQRRHGRAGYELKNKKFIFKRREERFSEIWDAHPDAVRRLWQSENAPLEAREMALRILRAKQQEIPTNLKHLEEFLNSASPLLQSYATRAAWQHLESGGTLGGNVIALALLASPASLREKFENWAENANWDSRERRAFGAQLQRAVSAARPDGKEAPWRRRDYAARLLAGVWNEFLDQNALLENLPFWLRLSDENLMARILEVLRQAGQARGDELAVNLRTLSRQLPKIAANQREELLEAFLSGAASREFKGEEALSLVNQDDIAALGWRILERADLKLAEQQTLWNPLFRGQAGSEALRLAFSSPAAIHVFKFAQLNRVEDILRAWTETSSAPFEYASAEFFEALLAVLPQKDHARYTFRALALMPLENANALWEKHAALADNYKPIDNDFRRANFYHYQNEVGARAWDFLARSKVTPTTLREMWTNLFRMAQWSQLSGAFTNALAPGLLRRAEFPAAELEALLKQFPRVLEVASPEF